MFKRIFAAMLLLMVQFAAFAADPEPAQTSNLLDQVVNYTKQFYQAALPVVQKAYAIGLMTLQIDAANNILILFLILISSTIILRILWVQLNEAAKRQIRMGNTIPMRELIFPVTGVFTSLDRSF